MIENITTLAVLGLGMNELLVVLLIAMLVFGAARIPEIAKSLGKSIREFKKGASEGADDDEKKNAVKPEDKPKT
jgi:sec-independent protein translocase protein TatA